MAGPATIVAVEGERIEFNADAGEHEEGADMRRGDASADKVTQGTSDGRQLEGFHRRKTPRMYLMQCLRENLN